MQRKLRPGQRADSERKEWERELEEKEESRSLEILCKGLRGKGSRLNNAQLHTKRQKEHLKRRARMKDSYSKTAPCMSYNSNYETVWEVGRGGILEKQIVSFSNAVRMSGE